MLEKQRRQLIEKYDRYPVSDWGNPISWRQKLVSVNARIIDVQKKNKILKKKMDKLVAAQKKAEADGNQEAVKKSEAELIEIEESVEILLEEICDLESTRELITEYKDGIYQFMRGAEEVLADLKADPPDLD